MAQYSGSFQISLIDNQRTYIRYAMTNHPLPEEMSENPDGMKYIGICTESDSIIAPTDPSEYMWVLIGNDVAIENIKMKYIACSDDDIDSVPPPTAGDSDFIVSVGENPIEVKQGIVEVKTSINTWGYEIPPYDSKRYLFEVMEITMSDGSIIYSEIQKSSAWDTYNKLNIGGANLIRNSKTLVDERIYWKE